MNIKAIKKLSDGTTVDSVVGIISNVSDRKTGTGKKGEWSVQNFKITHEGEFMWCSIWNVECIKHCETGNFWEFAADRGIKVIDKAGKEGKIYKNLDISRVEPRAPEEHGNVGSRPQETTTQQAVHVDGKQVTVNAQGDFAKLMMLALEVAFQVQSTVGEDKLSNADAHTWARQIIINWEKAGVSKAIASAWDYSEIAERFKGEDGESQEVPF